MRKSSSNYRGSRRSGGILVPVLVVLCVLAAVALYIINNNLTFTREGSYIIPEKEQKVEKVQANLIIDDEEPDETTETMVPQEEIAEAETVQERAMFVPIGSVKNADLFKNELDRASQMGIRTLVIEVKAEDGTLAFATSTKIGQSTGLAGDDTVFNGNLKLARESGYRIAFYLSCFKDNEAARKNQGYSVRTANKVIWIDGGDSRWLSAYSGEARGYITALIKELVLFTPDEFILANISFPVYGRTELISYPDGAGDKEDAIKSFIGETLLAAENIPISAVYENYTADYLSRSGQRPEDFTVFDKLYIRRDAGKLNAPLSGAAISHKKVVPIQSNVSDGDFLIK